MFEFMRTIFKKIIFIKMALDKKKRATNMPSMMVVKVEMLYGHHL